jgi:Glycoside-hydrolase family GH114
MLQLRWAPPALAAALLLAAPSTAAARTLPPIDAQFDYQIGGAYPPAGSVGIVDRDRGDEPAAGKYNVCYVNAFQTQSEDAAWWRANHPDLLLRRDGAYVVDEAWNEILLDVSTAAKRAALADVVGGWIDGCASAGFDAVEPDNLDSWTRSDGLLTSADALAYAQLLALRAHADGLAIAQKNASELGLLGKLGAGFDFAIAEECHVYVECGDYTSVYGHEVYEIEYAENGGEANFIRACRAHGERISIAYRDVGVAPADEPGYVYRSC